MKKCIRLLFVIVFISNSIYCQEPKLKVALVYDLDSTFTLKKMMAPAKAFNVNLSSYWREAFHSHLDTSMFIIGWEKMPDNLLPVINWTNGFSKANKRLRNWFTDLNIKKEYDVVIILTKANLHPSSTYAYISNYSFGLYLTHNFCFSLNDVISYKTSNSEIIYRSRFYGTEDYITYFNKNEKKKKKYKEIQVDDLTSAIEGIIKLNNRVVKQVCGEIIEARKHVLKLE